MSPEIVLVSLMFVCTVGFLMLGFPVAYTLPGSALIFAFLGYYFDVGDLGFGLEILGSFYNRIFGIMDEVNEILVAIPLFVFMGIMLERSKVAAELLETMARFFGSFPGGLGISVTVVGMLLAASTGIIGATVVTMGLISLPTMLKNGYSPRLACGSIAASGTLGQIIPPSIVLVLLGDQISNSYIDARREIGDWSPDPVSIGDLFSGALIPGLVLVGLYITYQLGMALLRPESCPQMKQTERVSLKKIFEALVPPLVLIISVLGSILVGIATPTEAAALGAVGAILLADARLSSKDNTTQLVALAAFIIAFITKSLYDIRLQLIDLASSPDAECGFSILDACIVTVSDQTGNLIAVGVTMIAVATIFCCLGVALYRIFRVKVLGEVCDATLRTTCMVFAILIGAQLFNVVFRGLGGEELVAELFDAVTSGPVGAMLLVMLVMFILGFFLDFIEIILIIVPIVAPVLFKLDVYPISDPVWVAIMMAINLQTSFLTPPFGFALFYLRGVAPKSIKTSDIYLGVIPFVIIQVIMLSLLWAFPHLATWLPSIIYD